jgi:hypothetical protein
MAFRNYFPYASDLKSRSGPGISDLNVAIILLISRLIVDFDVTPGSALGIHLAKAERSRAVTSAIASLARSSTPIKLKKG